MRSAFHRRRGVHAALLWGACAVASTFSTVSHAQSAGTTQKPLPNILLLVDTSGSMEKMIDGSDPEANTLNGAAISAAPFNACSPGVESNPNRWGSLLQALTGNIQPYYSCVKVDRASNAFNLEYRINSTAPYDTTYYLPYHRPISGSSAANSCAIGPYALPGTATGSGVGPARRGAGGNANDFPATAIATYPYTDLLAISDGTDIANRNTCSFDQNIDGQLDAARDYARFAMMTFDSDLAPGVGYTGTAVNTGAPMDGLWSYFSGSAKTGQIAGCSIVDFEVGARNAYAPPWEGRLIPFPRWDGVLTDIEKTNSQIQLALSTIRPYGATPIAGLLDDARAYLRTDTTGPEHTDDYVSAGCRDQFIVLMTDGAPNLDLRPECTTQTCPYTQAKDIIDDLYTSNPHSIKTFVIGFAVSGTSGAGGFPPPYTSCTQWRTAVGSSQALDAACTTAISGGTYAQAGTSAAACCTLNELAFHGQGAAAASGGAYFAESQADLIKAFASILATIAKQVTTRTVPIYSPVVSVSGNKTASATFLASFNPDPSNVWSGDIERQVALCDRSTGNLSAPSAPDPNKGDVFEQNVSQPSIVRNILTVNPDNTLTGSKRDGTNSIRPYAAATPLDGLPTYKGDETLILSSDLPNLQTKLTPDLFRITSSSCRRSKDSAGNIIPALSDANDCMKVAWGFATSTQASQQYGTPPYTGVANGSGFNIRCPDAAAGNCSGLGAIFHSEPAILTAPSSTTRDQGYRGFATAQIARTQTLFVSSTDGLLHAFDALKGVGGSGASPVNNEMWAFAAPAVLSKLHANYPGGQQIISDGSPVVKDVVFQRTSAEIADSTKWHSVLVSGFGPAGQGFYALDVTADGNLNTSNYTANPATISALEAQNANATKKGPHFLWQLTDIPDTTPSPDPAAKGVLRGTDQGGTKQFGIYGTQGATPAISTLYFDDGSGVKEVGVAILPGGSDGAPLGSGSCARSLTIGGADDLSPSGYAPRANVRQWGATCTSPVAGRGVSIVRLDTGEIIRHFSNSLDTPKRLDDKGIVISSALDAPMTGTPVVYPNEVGSIAKAFYIGDAEGTVWRFDVSSTNPSSWKAQLLLDTQSSAVNGASTVASSKPIIVNPVIALTPQGNLMLGIATGDQDSLGATPTTPASDYNNYVYSLTEIPTPSSSTTAPQYTSTLNWYLKFSGGERVTGPMAIFDSVFYFATYQPAPLSAVCSTGHSYLYGRDYVRPKTLGVPADGGLVVLSSSSADYIEPFTGTEQGQLIPGVSIRAQQPCAQEVNYTDYFGNTYRGSASVTPTQYELFAGVAAKSTSTTGSQLKTLTQKLRSPTQRTSVDSWATIVE